MKKTGNDAFTFPTGKSNYYRPIGIAAPTSTATVFTAEYLDANQTLGSTADTSIANLSDCEHWTLTRSGSSDNAIVALRPERELWTSYKLVSLYNAREWPDSARRLVDSIPYYTDLKGSDLTNYLDYRYIYRKADSLNVFKNIYRWHNLDSLSIARIQAIAANNPYQPGKQACNILMFIGVDTCSLQMPVLPLARYANRPQITENIVPQRVQDVGLKLFPNPTTGIFNAQYYLSESNENTTLEVYNLLGSLIYKQALSARQGIIPLSLNLSQGMYLVVLREGIKPRLSEKLIIE